MRDSQKPASSFRTIVKSENTLVHLRKSLGKTSAVEPRVNVPMGLDYIGPFGLIDLAIKI
jgi:hypothetical protein